MKKIICLICVIPMLAFGQMPVTDAAANTSLALMRNQLLQMNMQIKKTGIQLTTMNQNLERLINLLEENNTLTSKSKEILKEELEAKKGTPNFVLNSTEVSNTINLKDKILKIYRTSRESLRILKNIDGKESEEFLTYTANALIQATNLFKECKTILHTTSIIQPEERLKKIDNINIKLTEIFDGFTVYEQKLKQLNSSRDIRRTLIDLNKN